jgi:hypothetical protein
MIPRDTALNAPTIPVFLEGMHKITGTFDREIWEAYWVKSGIFGAYPDGTRAQVAYFGEDGQARPLDFQGIYYSGGFHISEAGLIGIIGANQSTSQRSTWLNR